MKKEAKVKAKLVLTSKKKAALSITIKSKVFNLTAVKK